MAMRTAEITAPVTVKNILYLTDFSQPSESALPFVTALGRGFGAKVLALHVLIPWPYVYTAPGLTEAAIEAAEETAQAEMQRVESRLAGLEHKTLVERGLEVWPSVRRAIEEDHVDLIVAGTHGRTGTDKLLMGSVAEEIFRRSPVPVLTIGPGVRSSAHNAGRFRRVLFATDLTPESLAAAPHAISLAQENRARLALLLVMRKPDSIHEGDRRLFEMSVAEAMHRLYEIVPQDATLEFPPEVGVEYGDPAERIVESAKKCNADVIVMGVRGAAGHLGAATHLERAIAHKIVAHAPCPVLTVRS
jgi:nucleotide-binding universal stress UspA family protein